MDFAALFTIANIERGNLSVYQQMNEERRYTYIHIHNGILSHKKEWNFTICSNLDVPRGYYAKWNKTEKNKFHMTSLTCGI